MGAYEDKIKEQSGRGRVLLEVTPLTISCNSNLKEFIIDIHIFLMSLPIIKEIIEKAEWFDFLEDGDETVHSYADIKKTEDELERVKREFASAMQKIEELELYISISGNKGQ